MYARPILCPNLIGRVEEMAIIEQAVLEKRFSPGCGIMPRRTFQS